jgi:hypothetical protein
VKQARLYKELNLRNCYALVNSLQLAKLVLDDNHIIFRNIKGHEIILYIFRQHIYIPKCENINQIEILTDKQTTCFSEIPIK